ncbi:MAG: hypothetical protein F6J93_23165 [Oscillatoria sp. SIO1A7]|nr:hypothetical protein [Oscillatoria sp. SIO1A7]
MNDIAKANAKKLTDCQNWKELVSNIEATLRADFTWDEHREKTLIQGLIQELDNDISFLITQCIDWLNTSQEIESVWSQVKAAATIFHRIADYNVNVGWAGMETEAEKALWMAAETWGVESRSALGENWSRHKLCLNSIIFALVNLNRTYQRMEVFFNSKISTYWKAYYILWDILWAYVDLNKYWNADYRQKNKLEFYELLAYCLENHQTEFASGSIKPKEACKFLQSNADDIPKNQPLRQKIYTGLTIYLKEFKYSSGEEVKVFDEIFDILGDDSVGFILQDTNLESEQAGKLLLSVPKALETIWDTGSTHRDKILQVLLAAMNGSDSQAQTQAKLFLKKHVPDELQRNLESQVGKLDTLDPTVNPEEIGNLIENLVELGSEVTLKAVLKKCAFWIASDENWTLVERAAQNIKKNPAAVQAAIYELNKGLDNRQVLRRQIREKIIAGNPALKQLFQNAAETPYDRLNELPRKTQQQYLDDLEKWCRDLKNRSLVYAERLTTYDRKIEIDSKEKPTALLELTEDTLDLLSQEHLCTRELKVQQMLTQLLSQMSDPRFYEDQKQKETYELIKSRLKTYAIEPLSKRLPNEEDIDTREYIVKVLSNVGGTAATDSLVRTVTSSERERAARQELLSEYYLKPSKERSEEAAKLLKDAVENAKSTMRLLQRLNLATFVMGVFLVFGGVVIAVYNDEWGSRLIGILSSMGGLGGIVTIFLRDPLQRIQDAMGNLVQIQTAFTGFVWELNLNGTYIQSQYVANGVLNDDDISQTVQRIDEVMDKTIHLIQVYTEGEHQVGSADISYLLPTTGTVDTTLTLLGQNLRGDERPGKSNKYQIAFNHKPVKVEVKAWTNTYIIIDLNRELLETLEMGDEPGVLSLWVSAIINGQETNSLLFDLTV